MYLNISTGVRVTGGYMKRFEMPYSKIRTRESFLYTVQELKDYVVLLGLTDIKRLDVRIINDCGEEFNWLNGIKIGFSDNSGEPSIKILLDQSKKYDSMIIPSHIKIFLTALHCREVRIDYDEKYGHRKETYLDYAIIDELHLYEMLPSVRSLNGEIKDLYIEKSKGYTILDNATQYCNIHVPAENLVILSKYYEINHAILGVEQKVKIQPAYKVSTKLQNSKTLDEAALRQLHLKTMEDLKERGVEVIPIWR